VLYRAPVRDLKSGRISRRYSYTVVVMQYYPRFVTRELVDEYVHSLAPDRELFTEFKTLSRELKDHDRAFSETRYEDRFNVSGHGASELQRLSALAKEKDVFFLCQCLPLEHCHADLLLLLAKSWFSAPTSLVRVKYPAFEARVATGDLRIPPV
jgi:uncharacterized protein YeaO (DUF488 family)